MRHWSYGNTNFMTLKRVIGRKRVKELISDQNTWGTLKDAVHFGKFLEEHWFVCVRACTCMWRVHVLGVIVNTNL